MSRMPVVFISHGLPVNAVENNKFTEGWKQISEKIPKPKAILVISAHWYTDETKVTMDENMSTIYDFYGFPRELYAVEYNTRGSLELSNRVKELLGRSVTFEYSKGLDHGAWVVLSVMYPEADIPVVQLSINSNIDISSHFYMAEKLKPLRDEGILILGSGNVVNNMERLCLENPKGYDWAVEFDRYIKDKVLSKKFEDILDYRNIGKSARLAVPSSDHFCPLLYVLGVCDADDDAMVYNNECIYGSLSMTSYILGL